MRNVDSLLDALSKSMTTYKAYSDTKSNAGGASGKSGSKSTSTKKTEETPETSGHTDEDITFTIDLSGRTLDSSFDTDEKILEKF